MSVTIINLTPHTITLFAKEGDEVIATFEPSGQIARAAQTDQVVGSIEVNGVPVDVVESRFGDVSNLPDPFPGTPDPKDGIYYYVSITTAQATKAHGRSVGDLLISSDPVRNDEGRIIGCRRFARI